MKVQMRLSYIFSKGLVIIFLDLRKNNLLNIKKIEKRNIKLMAEIKMVMEMI